MKMTYDQLASLAVDSIEAAFGISEEELAHVGESPVFDLGCDEGVSVEVYFDEPDFMRGYSDALSLSMFFCVTKEGAAIYAFIGSGCSNPELADEFTDRFMETTKFPGIWEVPNMCVPDDGLMLASDFSFTNEEELGEELVKRLSLFTNERFTNELRPFLHYFVD